MSAHVEFTSENISPDGSYSSLVKHYGREYAVHYVASEIRLYGTSVNRPLPRWQWAATQKAITEAVRARIDAQGPEFQANHVALYAEDVAA